MNTIVLLSGGMDSTTLLYKRVSMGDNVKALSVNYGQRHSKELAYATATCVRLGIEHRVADLTGISEFLAGSSLTSDEVAVPEGHYAEESMKATVVPNRNMIMLSVATAWVISSGFEQVAYAAHAGDHAIYPDCRPEFVGSIRRTIYLADWKKVHLFTPFLHLRKHDIVALGYKLGIDFRTTWSCYKGGELHCGRCGTCTERIEAFKLAELEDPTEYEDA